MEKLEIAFFKDGEELGRIDMKSPRQGVDYKDRLSWYKSNNMPIPKPEDVGTGKVYPYNVQFIVSRRMTEEEEKEYGVCKWDWRREVVPRARKVVMTIETPKGMCEIYEPYDPYDEPYGRGKSKIEVACSAIKAFMEAYGNKEVDSV